MVLGLTSGQEDCLYLSVYTKATVVPDDDTDSASLLPVMIYIHGGGFMAGSSDEGNMGPEIWMQKDIVSTGDTKVVLMGLACYDSKLFMNIFRFWSPSTIGWGH